MKRFFLCLSFLLLIHGFAQAQFSVGLNATYHTFFGKMSDFPTGDVDDFPAMIGGELRGMYGLGYKTAMKLGLMYRTTGENTYMYKSPATVTDMGADLKAYYYLLGSFNASNAALYTFAGVSGHSFKMTWQRDHIESSVPPSDQVYFDDKNVLRLHGNLGLGVEFALGSVYWFTEGQVAFLMNHFVNGTTIKTVPQRDFWSVSMGIRLPFGALSPPW
ncbi:MAG: hypothetical protein ACFCUI_13075 [Bernardetiaceae bacterium]